MKRLLLAVVLLTGCTEVKYAGKPGVFVCHDFRDGEEVRFHSDTIRKPDFWRECLTVTTLEGQERIICAEGGNWKCKPVDVKP